MIALVRMDRRMLARAPRKNLHRLAMFLQLEVPCSCGVCLVEAIIRKLDRDELLAARQEAS